MGLCVGAPPLGALLPGWDAVLAVMACCTGKVVGSISNSGMAVGTHGRLVGGGVRLWPPAAACKHAGVSAITAVRPYREQP